jgi:hypothetical protein
MLFQRINRSDAEKIFIVCQNVSGSTMTAGYAAAFDTGSSVDGVRVSQPTKDAINAFAGVADADIANNAYGLIQVYGYRSSIYISSSAGSSATGDPLMTVASNWGLRPFYGGCGVGVSSCTMGYKAFGFLCEAISASSSSTFATTAKAFIRAL